MKINSCLVLAVCFSLFTALSASTFISDGVFGSSVSAERRLLQAKTSCQINFEFQNYTIITSRCKGPSYPPKMCCPAFTEFACPFAEEINDLSTDCATTMFSYINLYGKYPPGLFASTCRDTKEGLECDAQPPSASQTGRTLNHNNAGQVACELLPLLVLVAASLALLLQYV